MGEKIVTIRDFSKTTVTVLAGEEGKQTFVSVFYGVITEAFASFSGGSSTFKVKASTINLLAKTLSPPFSRRGSVLVSSLLADICKRADIILVDHGGWKNRTLTNHYSEGTALTQISKIVAAVKSTFNYIPFPATEGDISNSPVGELLIWGPHYNEERDDKEHIKNDKNIPVISSSTGMIGYPEYSASGINFFTLFRPDISFYGPIHIDSAYIPGAWQLVKGTKTNQDGQNIQAANKNFDGLWLPKRIDYYLTSEVADPVAFKPDGPDGGNWFTYVQCQRSDVSPAYIPKDKPKDEGKEKK
ncbi:hypothetical protein GS501_04925 [Saccharibacter sp. 17.LH.SD]|uniref:hypothetical protein n=1 Tax=Saccharibacter sp. 17.LH.SD TaxID=2689393 RepID=UPI00136B6A32|nr:hypothetical protein [Saccharibacter sp. 17.LH.SD]MXV44390.1 hypothetical protein [Saccharibacter sp. 17.LH.SD]